MKSLKKLFPLLMTLALILCAIFAFASCGEDQSDEPVTYTVSVVDSSGVGIGGAVVKFKVGNAPDGLHFTLSSHKKEKPPISHAKSAVSPNNRRG